MKIFTCLSSISSSVINSILRNVDWGWNNKKFYGLSSDQQCQPPPPLSFSKQQQVLLHSSPPSLHIPCTETQNFRLICKVYFLGGWGVENVKLWWMDIGWYCFWKVGNSNWQLLSLFAASCWMGFSKHAWSDNRRERKRSGNVPFCREPWRSVSQQSITFSILIVFLSRRTLETDLENVAANCWVGFFLQTCVSVGVKLPNNVFFVFLLKLSLSLI